MLDASILEEMGTKTTTDPRAQHMAHDRRPTLYKNKMIKYEMCALQDAQCCWLGGGG